jgi:putative membrane protein
MAGSWVNLPESGSNAHARECHLLAFLHPIPEDAMKRLLIACAAALATAFGTAAFAQQDKAGDTKASQQQGTKGANADAKRLRDLALANLAEIEAGKLAVSKASDADVKKFAQKMVDDHSKQLQELQSLAQSKNVELPSAPDAKHQREMKKLQDLSGADFDRAYMRAQIKDHRDAHKLAAGTAKRGKDPEVKAAAGKAAPQIQDHLQMAQQISGEHKGGAASGKSRKNAEGNQTGAGAR